MSGECPAPWMHGPAGAGCPHCGPRPETPRRELRPVRWDAGCLAWVSDVPETIRPGVVARVLHRIGEPPVPVTFHWIHRSWLDRRQRRNAAQN